ncbi:MAG: hypothetical protein H0X28_06985 [Solirubrobacterales bacterium]|nr:hypothetical protein [Solirubrobacterales bacterium]
MRLRAARLHALAVAAALVALALSACGASAEGTDDGSPLVRPPARPTLATSAAAPLTQACGAAGPRVLAEAAGTVAKRIYAGELTGSETRSDQRQVEGDAPLLNAIAGGNSSAIDAAVHRLVYSHTHIVRLRITRGASVLSDIGGPYIIAPVGGALRLHGRTIARYVFSVQDDLGYVKLVTRFLGVPLVMRAGSHGVAVEGLVPGPANIPDLGPVSYRGATYEAISFSARSFPGGPLRISLLVPVPSALASRSCSQINSAEAGHAALLISRRFQLSPAGFPVYVKLVRTLTDGLLYIRAGSHELAGSTRPSPPTLPTAGPVSFAGRSYEVSSFTAPSSVGQVRVYVLTRAD